MLMPSLILAKKELVTKTIGIPGSSATTYLNINDANGRHAGFRFTMAEAGILKKIRWWDAGTSSGTYLRAMLYSDNAGSPGTLLSSSSFQLVYPSKWPDPWEFLMADYEMEDATPYWSVFETQSSGMGTTTLRALDNQAGYGSGRNNTITAITDNLGYEWCSQIEYLG